MNRKTELFTLHRYFIWTDRMRVHFDNTLKNKKKLTKKDSTLTASYTYPIGMAAYML